MTPALELKSLRVSIGGKDILSGVNLSLSAGRITGLVGRSGSGKSMTAYAAMGLLPADAQVKGDVLLNGRRLSFADDAAMSAVRGAQIAMVFQEPMTALNPLQTIEAQVAELFLMRGETRESARAGAHRALAQAGLPPKKISPKRYPHELSGGQRQRVVIAMAVALKPAVILADEPTTALDVTTQSEILHLLKSLCAENRIALLLITHDLGVVAKIADDIALLDKGRIIETASIATLNGEPESAFAKLIAARERSGTHAGVGEAAPALLAARDIRCSYREPHAFFPDRENRVYAVDGASFEIRRGECLGLVGESGSGKSTLARAMLGLQTIASGKVALEGQPIDFRRNNDLRRLRRQAQIVFQDPYSSFNPRLRIEQIVAEPLHLLAEKLSAAEKRARVAGILETVGLEAAHAQRFPDAFSGGQRQRIAIARALIVEPTIIILDEATSALDTIARNRILDLLRRLKSERGVSYLFIAHDLNVIRGIADRIAVMKDGAIIETGAAGSILDAPQHAYTKTLVAAAADLQSALDTVRAPAI